MKLDKQQKEEILRKNQELEEIKPILKREFKGIDSVIDSIIENIRPFYVFPESLKRPLVVNLWGLTGTGKTSVVERIVELLKLGHKYCKFDVGEYTQSSSEYQLKSDLSDKVEQCTDKHLVLVFDEFQLGRTISESGAEVDRPSLRAIWDVIDSGVIRRFNKNTNNCSDIYHSLKRCADAGVVVENGVVIGGEDVYHGHFRNKYLRCVDFVTYPDFNSESPESDSYEENENAWYPLQLSDEAYSEDGLTERAHMYKTEYNNASTREHYKTPYFIKYEMFLDLFAVNPTYFQESNDYEKWKHHFRDNHNTESLLKLIYKEFIQKMPLMVSENYSQSLIFCIGNIDEAYEMTHSSDPDADADLFHEHSLKISTTKMKDALSTRFRMEQIGRLGNTHIVYPALSRKSYCEIIEKYLNQRVKDFEQSFGIKLIPNDSIEKILYKEAVFPTQGARPILSTFSTLVDSYVSRLINDIIFKNEHTTTIEWSYEEESDETFYNFKTISPKKTLVLKYPVKLNVENLRKSDFSETQAFVAVHEAGHAVVSIMKNKLMPQEVKSRTASIAEGFCYVRQPEITTKETAYGGIMMCLAGLEAEKLIFGDDNMSVGGVSDLSKATTMAAAMVKTYGMAEHMHQISVDGETADSIYNAEANQKAEQWAIETIHKAQKETKEILNNNKQFLLELANYLSLFPVIYQNDLEKMAEKYNPEIKSKDKYFEFKNKIKEQMQAIGLKHHETQEEMVKSLNSVKKQ